MSSLPQIYIKGLKQDDEEQLQAMTNPDAQSKIATEML